MHELFSAVSGILVPTFGWDGLDCVCFIEYEYYKNHKETERLCLCWLQDTNSVVSKKWSNSTVQLRLDQFLDKITHSTASWHALRHSVSPSISLFMNSECLPPSSCSFSLLSYYPLYFFLHLCISQFLSALHIGSAYYRMVISVQVYYSVADEGIHFYLLRCPTSLCVVIKGN